VHNNFMRTGHPWILTALEQWFSNVEAVHPGHANLSAVLSEIRSRTINQFRPPHGKGKEEVTLSWGATCSHRSNSSGADSQPRRRMCVASRTVFKHNERNKAPLMMKVQIRAVFPTFC
jgi:hypothetical protein